MHDNRLNNEAASIAKSLERIAEAVEIGNAIAAGHAAGCASLSNEAMRPEPCDCGRLDAKRAARAIAARRSRQEGDKADG